MSINSLLTNEPILNAIATSAALSKVVKQQVATLEGPTTQAFAVTSTAFVDITLSGVAATAPLTLTLNNIPIGAAVFASYNSSVTVGIGGVLTEQLRATGCTAASGASVLATNTTIANLIEVVGGSAVFIATASTVTFTVQAAYATTVGSVAQNDTNISAFLI